MRYAVTGIEQATGERVTREVTCESEQEAAAFATLEGLAVERVEAVGPDAPARPARPARGWARAGGGDDPLVFGPDRDSTWGFLALGAAIVAGAAYFSVREGLPIVGVLATPFAVVCVAAGLLNRRNSLTLGPDRLSYRLRLKPALHVPYIRIHNVLTRTLRPSGAAVGEVTAVVVVLEDGTEHELTRVRQLARVAREIAARAGLG